MNICVFQHAPFEDIGCMASWLKKSGANVTYTRFFEDTVLPRIEGIGLVIIMGGPMSANDEAVLPWLRAEKEFIRSTVASGVAVLGVCLGGAAHCQRVWRARLSESQKRNRVVPDPADSV